MKYAAFILALFVAHRVIVSLFPFSDEVFRYATIGAALVAVCVFVMSEVKNSRTIVE